MPTQWRKILLKRRRYLYFQPLGVIIKIHGTGFRKLSFFSRFVFPSVKSRFDHFLGSDTRKMHLVRFPVECHCAVTAGNAGFVGAGFTNFIARLGLTCGDAVAVFQITLLQDEIAPTVFAALSVLSDILGGSKFCLQLRS